MESNYKAMKYHYKIQNELHNMQDRGIEIPQGYGQFLKPFNQSTNLVKYDKSRDLSGGSKYDSNTDYHHKSMKYHYKIQNELHKMQDQGKQIPYGYEQYLRQFE